MATSMLCCIHLVEKLNEDKIISFSDKGLEKVRLSQSEWINLDGEEKNVAENLNNFHLETYSNIGYHRQCYMRFTYKSKIQKAKKRIEIRPSSGNAGNSRKVELNRRRSFQKSTNTGIFPDICVICKKEQYVTEKYSQKRKREKLSQCLTYNASESLQKSSRILNDDRLKTEIEGIDCIAKEVKYHRSCYLNYTSVLKKSNEVLPCAPNPISKSYKLFCETIIESRIINSGEILSMNKLLKLFTNVVEKNEENTCTINVDNRQLKRWLLRDYPQLIFVKPRQRNMSELVLTHSSDKGAVILQETEETTTDSGSEVENFLPSKPTVHMGEMQEIYNSAMRIKKLIEESPSLECTWPPTAENFSNDSVLAMIPDLLFNFIAWCSGITDEAELEKKVNIPKNLQKNLASISQDIIYFSSRGKKQTPNSAANSVV